jgi:uncharacterized membrane protein
MRIRVLIPAIPPAHVSKRRKSEKMGVYYLVDDVETVSHGLLWANLGFLFTLIPFGTSWVGERGLSPFALSIYLICCAVPALSWFVLSITVRQRTHVPVSPMKQAVSSALYVGAIPVSYRSLTAAMLMLAAVAVLWIIPRYAFRTCQSLVNRETVETRRPM